MIGTQTDTHTHTDTHTDAGDDNPHKAKTGLGKKLKMQNCNAKATGVKTVSFNIPFFRISTNRDFVILFLWILSLWAQIVTLVLHARYFQHKRTLHDFLVIIAHRIPDEVVLRLIAACRLLHVIITYKVHAIVKPYFPQYNQDIDNTFRWEWMNQNMKNNYSVGKVMCMDGVMDRQAGWNQCPFKF